MAKDAEDKTEEPKVEEPKVEEQPAAVASAADLAALQAELVALKAQLAARDLVPVGPLSAPIAPAAPVKWHYATGKNGTVTATTTPDGE